MDFESKSSPASSSTSFSHGLVQFTPSRHASSVYWSLVAAWPLGDKSFCVATPTGLILVSEPPARLGIFVCLLLLFFFKANALIFALQPEGLLSLLSCPLASKIGPGASGRLLRVRKRARTFPGNRGASPQRLSIPPSLPAKPRWGRRERAAALAPVLLLLLQTRAGTPASTRCTAPARPLARPSP